MKRINSSMLIHGDCMEVLDSLIEKGVKLDMVFADLPYNETANKWDKKLDHALMFEKLEVLIKEEGAMLFTGTFRFGIQLYNARPDLYRYDWVWEKDNGTNFPHVKMQPLRVHEYVFVFGKGRITNGKRTPMKFNPQMTEGTPYKAIRKGARSTNWRGGVHNVDTDNKEGLRYPRTVQFFSRGKDRGLHPTQKPVALLEYLIKSYSDEGDLVLDFTMGSGTTGVACQNLGRRFIGVDIEEEYFLKAIDRLSLTQSS